MARDLRDMNELYGQGLDGKKWVMNGHLLKQEVKKEEEKHQKNSDEDIKKEEEMTNANSGKDANSISAHPCQPSSVINTFTHPLNDRPQLSVKVEEGHAMGNGGDSLLDELQQLKDALKSKELLNSMLIAKLEQVRKEKNEEQRKSALAAEELKLAKEKLDNIDKEREMEASIDMQASTTLATLQPSRAVVAARLLGIDRQLLGEPNEWKEKFEQLNVKYLKVKRLYRTEHEVAAKLRKKLKDKESYTIEVNEEQQSLGDAGQVEAIESDEAVSSPPVQNDQLLRQQMDVEEGDGEEGRVQKKGTVAIHHLGVYRCAQCPPDRLAFSTVEQLARHQRRYHIVRQHYRHQCPDCGLACKSKSELEKHRRTHTGEKPHKCKECGKAFAQKGNLTSHERQHTGERPFVCPVCQQAFAAPNNLLRHARAHSGETPFSCQHCARQFKRADQCRCHEKICLKRPSATE